MSEFKVQSSEFKEETDCRVASAPRNDNGWISVKDKLPEDGQEVWYFKPCYDLKPGWGIIDHVIYTWAGFNCVYNNDNQITGVTYWMPFVRPEPPKVPTVEWVRKDEVLRTCPAAPTAEEIIKIEQDSGSDVARYLVGWCDGVRAYKDLIRALVGEERDA